MQPSTPPGSAGRTPSSADLPYGPLPVRSSRTTTGPSGSTPLEQLVDLSLLPPAPPPPGAQLVEEPDQVDDAAASSDSSVSVSLTTPRPETDDDVHFGVAARALGVSRKTVERMGEGGE